MELETLFYWPLATSRVKRQPCVTQHGSELGMVREAEQTGWENSQQELGPVGAKSCTQDEGKGVTVVDNRIAF